MANLSETGEALESGTRVSYKFTNGLSDCDNNLRQDGFKFVRNKVIDTQIPHRKRSLSMVCTDEQKSVCKE